MPHPSIESPRRPADGYYFVEATLAGMEHPKARCYFVEQPDVTGYVELHVAGKDGIETRWLFPTRVAEAIGALAQQTGRSAWTGRTRTS